MWHRLTILAWLAASPLAAAAETFDARAALCEAAITSGAAQAGVPPAVLRTISLAETGRARGGRLRPWPWTVNREGKGYWFATRAEALAFARTSVADGRSSIDLGCFQINFRWHGSAFASLDAMLDPQAGADYAARFLRSLYAERGDWAAAAGAYHSRTPQRAAVYRARFERILAGLDEAPPAPTVVLGEPARPRRSRTRMSRRPLIITVAPAAAPEAAGETAAGPPGKVDILFTAAADR